LRGTIDLKLALGAGDITKMESWIGVSYGIHEDCRSHTGGLISWDWGELACKSQKQKLNTKRSTEGEIVGVRYFMPNMIWARMFLKAQGFKITQNILHQDNQNAMKIIKNGRIFNDKKTKHMGNRYFWIKDPIKSEHIDVRYCPTEKMIADFLTKPLQGKLFRKFRDIILGYKHIRELDNEDEEITSEGRVRSNIENTTINTSVNGPSCGVSWADIVSGKSNEENMRSTNALIKLS